MLPRRIWDQIRSMGSDGQPYSEIRGWRFELVSPRRRARPTASEIASPCPTRRDVYLRRVQRISPPPGGAAAQGVAVHEAFLEPLRLVQQGVRGLDGLAEHRARLLERLGAPGDGFLGSVYDLGAAAALQLLLDGDIPVSVEPEIPGAAVGLSSLRPDLLVGFIPVEVTAAAPGSLYAERKRLQLAAYALALEAWTGVPVDYGVLLSIRRRGAAARAEWSLVQVDDALRRSLLRARDETAAMIEEAMDPGAAGPGECPAWCPFRGAPGCPPPAG